MFLQSHLTRLYENGFWISLVSVLVLILQLYLMVLIPQMVQSFVLHCIVNWYHTTHNILSQLNADYLAAKSLQRFTLVVGRNGVMVENRCNYFLDFKRVQLSEMTQLWSNSLVRLKGLDLFPSYNKLLDNWQSSIPRDKK